MSDMPPCPNDPYSCIITTVVLVRLTSLSCNIFTQQPKSRRTASGTCQRNEPDLHLTRANFSVKNLQKRTLSVNACVVSTDRQRGNAREAQLSDFGYMDSRESCLTT